MEHLTLQNIGLVTGFLLILIGLYGVLTNKNILRIIVAFTLFDSGLNLVIVALSYMKGRVAPIIDSTTGVANLSDKFVDPIGTFYRYGLPASMLKRKNMGPSAARV